MMAKQLEHQRKAWEALLADQAAAVVRGRQKTYTQSQIAQSTGLTRSRVEQLEIVAKLRLMKELSRRFPESFFELGGTRDQLAFLSSIHITSANARGLWRTWCNLEREQEVHRDAC